MKKITSSFCIALFISATVLAQECVFYFPKTKNATLEYKHYDKKDKYSGRTVQKIKEIIESGTATKAIVTVDYYDDKDKQVSSHDIEVFCEAGVYYMDMENFLNEQMLQQMESLEAKVETDNLQYPPNLKVGDKLPDGWLKMELSSSGFKIMTMEITITNREVVSRENVTTPAGTFMCTKLNQTTESKGAMGFSTESSEWLSEDVGIVKSESYNSKGEKTGYMELTSITK